MVDQDLLTLGTAFNLAVRVSEILEGMPAAFFEEAVDEADTLACDLAKAIARMPANTLEGIRTKAIAAAWCFGPPSQDDPRWSIAEKLSVGVVRELLAITQGSNLL